MIPVVVLILLALPLPEKKKENFFVKLVEVATVQYHLDQPAIWVAGLATWWEH